jgi:Fe-S cluster biogenesis protein NfuA
VDPQVEMVVARFGSMLASEDATLTIDSITDGVLKLRYSHGDGADCDTCVLTPEDLTALVSEALTGRVEGISGVAISFD